jgi:hypothetical protein
MVIARLSEKYKNSCSTQAASIRSHMGLGFWGHAERDELRIEPVVLVLYSRLVESLAVEHIH